MMKRKVDLLFCTKQQQQCNNNSKKTASTAASKLLHEEDGEGADNAAMNLGVINPFELLPNELLWHIFEQCQPCHMWHRVL